jgi:hypothetical protein
LKFAWHATRTAVQTTGDNFNPYVTRPQHRAGTYSSRSLIQLSA